MKRIIALLLCAVCSVGTVFAAKNVCTVSGRILDAVTNEPLAYATIAVRNWEEAVVAATTSAEDGTFSLPNVPFGDYAIEISFMGYKTLRLEDKSINTATLKMGDLLLEEDVQTIAETVITAKVPVIEHKIDKIVMNVAEAVSTQGSNALDVLRKAPGVTVDMDGNVKLNGQAVSVWIDGRPSYLSGIQLEALLRATDGTTIDKIELMANPSSKYDAEGSGGIINIRLKRNIMQGFNGMVTGTYGAMKHNLYEQEANAGVNLNYRGAKSSTSFNYNGQYQDMGAVLEANTAFEGTGLEQTSHSDFMIGQTSHMAKLSHDYFINKKHTVGGIVTAMSSGLSQDNYGDNNMTNLFMNKTMLSSQNSTIETSSINKNIRANLNYTGLFDESKGQELTVNVDYAYFDIYSYNFQDNSYIFPVDMMGEVFRQNSTQYINMFSGKVDYQQTIWKNGSLEVGGKWASTFTDNDLTRDDYVAGAWTPAKNLSNIFNYTEQIGALYASVGKMFGTKWMMKAGLRGEYTRSVGHWLSAGESSHKQYFNVFPTAFVGFNPSADWRFTFSYTARISRPSFDQLNPFRTYVDANSYTEGNPELGPQLANQLVLNVGFKNYYNLSLIGARTKDLIMSNPYYNPETAEKLLLMENFGTQTMFGGALALSELPLTKWMYVSLQGTGIYMLNQADPTLEKGDVQNNGWITQAYGQFTFVLPKNFKVELAGIAVGKMPTGYFVTDPIFYASGGVKKTFWDNRATLTLNCNDLFNTMATNLHYNLEGVSYYLKQGINMQKFSLSFSFRFGQSKATRARKVGDFEETNRVGTSNATISTSAGGGIN